VIRELAVFILVSALACSRAPAQSGWTTPVNIDNSHQRFSISPSFDFDAGGRIHASWTDFLDSSRTVRYATNATGAWIKSSVPVPGLSGGRNTNRVIVTPDQVIHLFLNAEGGSPSQTHAWVLTKPVSGGSWSAPVQISDATVGGNFGWAAMDASGGIYAVWVKIRFDPNRGELYGRYKPLGSAWGPIETIKIASSNGWPSGNYVTARGNRFCVGYNNSEAKPWLRVREDGVWGPQRQVAATGFAPYVVEEPGTGKLVAVYHIDWKNWFCESSDGGVTWSTPTPLSEGSFFDRNVVAAFDANADLHVLWRKTQAEGQGSRCYYRARIRGTWRAQQDISPWALNNAGPDVGSLVARDGDVHALFIADVLPNDYGDAVYMIKPGDLGPDVTPPGQVTNFTAAAGNTTVQLNWTNPADIDFAGTMIRFKTTGFPASTTDGALAVNSTGGRGQARSFTHNNRMNGLTHYYAAFAYDDVNNAAAPATASALPFGPADFDKDGDVDQSDFGAFQQCYTGAAVPQNDPACIAARLDDDEDVDANDFAILQGCLSGAGVPANPNCAG